MKYNITYKYFELKANEVTIRICVNRDTTLGKEIYGASSNILFLDKNEGFCYAAGIGKSEYDALSMCINEINNYLSDKKYKELFNDFKPFKISDLKEINMAGTISIILNKNKSLFCYFKKIDDKLEILTDTQLYTVDYASSILDTIFKNIDIIKTSNSKNFTSEYLRNSGFELDFHTGKTLDDLCLKNKKNTL